MFRGDLIRHLGGFDEQFFYHYEEVDLCRRVWQAGYSIIYTPEATITHLGGQSVNRFPIKFEIEKHRNRYRYFYKYYGPEGARRCRLVALVRLRVRQLGYGMIQLARPTDTLKSRMHMYRVAAEWNRHLDPVRFIEVGEEPEIEANAFTQIM
jgi:GT2 family glycosyltransferase